MTNFIGYEFPKCAKKGSTLYLFTASGSRLYIKEDTWREINNAEYIDHIRGGKD